MNSALDLALRHAQQLERQGRYPESIAAYRAVLARQPGLADAWYDLAWLLRQQGQFDDALAAYAHALAHGVREPEEVHLNRAVILTDHLHDHAAAARELQAALTCRPGYPPALLNLGNLREEQGHADAAIACYRELLALPESVSRDGQLRLEALSRLLHLCPAASSDDPLLVTVQRQADSTAAMPDTVRANLYFALGRAYDALGNYDQAIHCLHLANRWASRGGPAYRPDASAQWTDSLIAATLQALPKVAPAAGSDGDIEPVFICGMFRSGSTLIEQVLGAHPQVAAAGELGFFPQLAARLAPYPAGLARLDDASANTLARQYCQHLARLIPADRQSVRYVSDKRPDNFLLLGLIKRLFPRAKIIHTTRSPMDTGLSIYMHHLDQRVAPHSSDLAAIGHYYGQYRRLMQHNQRCWPADLHEINYDQFVLDPEPAVRALLNFLDLPWDSACLDFHLQRNAVKTASYWQVRRPLYRDASGRWLHYRRHLQPLLAALEHSGVTMEPK